MCNIKCKISQDFYSVIQLVINTGLHGAIYIMNFSDFKPIVDIDVKTSRFENAEYISTNILILVIIVLC